MPGLCKSHTEAHGIFRDKKNVFWPYNGPHEGLQGQKHSKCSEYQEEEGQSPESPPGSALVQ